MAKKFFRGGEGWSRIPPRFAIMKIKSGIFFAAENFIIGKKNMDGENGVIFYKRIRREKGKGE